MKYVLAAVALLLGAGCKKPVNMGSEIANQRLHDHIVETHRGVLVEHLGADTVWSDSAIIERAPDFPKPVRAVIDAGQATGSTANVADRAPGAAGPAGTPAAAVAPNALVNFLGDVDRRKAQWRDAEVHRKGTGDYDCEVRDATAAAIVNCVYVNYVEARYPRAKFRITGTYEPVLLVEGDVVRAALMPMKF